MPEEAPKMNRVGRLDLEKVPYLSTFSLKGLDKVGKLETALCLSTFSPKGLDKVGKPERVPYLSTFSDRHYKNLSFLFYSWKIPTFPFWLKQTENRET